MSGRFGLGILFAVAMLAGVSPAGAQSAESEPPPARGTFKVEPLPSPTKPFGLPDVPQSVMDRTSVQSPWFTLKFGLVTLVDYTGFSQDAASVDQVGTQESQWDARSLRLMLRGTVGSSYTVKYLVAGEYKGFESDPDNLWNITDVSLTFSLGGPATTLTVGKTKETFAYEMVGDAANLAQQERVLSPFFVSTIGSIRGLPKVTEDPFSDPPPATANGGKRHRRRHRFPFVALVSQHDWQRQCQEHEHKSDGDE